MKVAIVHDYIREYGGAERVIEALCEAFPDAPIYTAFARRDSKAYEKFKHKKIIQSWAHWIPWFDTKFHSPLRFLAPFIWGSFNFSKYDVVISSASWYVTKGFGSRRSGGSENSEDSEKLRKDSSSLIQNDKSGGPIEFCYCHTPPRWLYGYKTSVEFQKYWPIKVYASVIGHFMRMYDFKQAQKVNYFIANSQEVAARIQKFYRRDSVVIYPPVSLPAVRDQKADPKKKDYYFMVSRLVGSKGLNLAVEAAHQIGINLKIAGVSAGYSSVYKDLSSKARSNVEFLGYVTDEELVKLYSEAKGFLALATDEDFGITPVESMMCGTPVIAYNGGGYKETVVDGKTGVLFDDESVPSLVEAIKKFETLRRAQGKKMEEACKKQAEKFSKERFISQIQTFVKEHAV
jgi:glycosyltransferase involved in cell wall biosynthesis